MAKKTREMKDVAFLAGLIGGAVTCYLFISIGIVDRVDGIPGTEEEPVLSLPTYLSFVSVMLTAVTVVLTAVAIGIGVVAAYTVRELNERADRRVQEAIDKALSEKALNDRVASFARQKQNPTVAELEEEFDLEDDGNR